MDAGGMLGATELFHDLKKDELELISRSTRVETYPKDHTIIREGRVGTAFYIIVSGRVEVVKGTDASSPAVAVLGPGEFFGEIASVRHLPRSASVRTLEETECIVIWRADFDGFISKFPEAAARIEAAARERLAGRSSIDG